MIDSYDAVQNARSEARYEWSEADAQTEAFEEARWGLGGAASRVEGDAE